MTYKLICQNSITGVVYDATTLAENIQHQTQLGGQPGKLTFSLKQDPNNVIQLSNGSIIRFSVNGEGIFFGYIFTLSTDEKDGYKVTAYDQMRYLKNEEVYLTSGMTADQIFLQVCKDNFPVVPPNPPRYKVVTPSSFIVPEYLHDKKTLYSIIEYGIQRANIAESKQYFLKDKFGTLLFTELAQEKTDLVIGERSLLTGYQYEASIDKNTYNAVKIVRDNETTGKRDVWIEFDSSTQKQWGKLQMVEKADESLNEAQIKELAHNLMQLRNRETKTMKMTALGDTRMVAGSGFVFELNKLNLKQHMWITSATHTYVRDYYTMQLGVFI